MQCDSCAAIILSQLPPRKGQVQPQCGAAIPFEFSKSRTDPSMPKSKTQQVQPHRSGQLFLACVSCDKLRDRQSFGGSAVQDIQRSAPYHASMFLGKFYGLSEDVLPF